MDFNAQRFTHLADLAWIWAAQFLPRLGAAVLILGVGFVAARWLSRAVNAALARAPYVDRTLHPLLVSVARYALLILVAIVALRQIGFETSLRWSARRVSPSAWRFRERSRTLPLASCCYGCVPSMSAISSK
jgi:small-conductance mechanosensitive channel